MMSKVFIVCLMAVGVLAQQFEVTKTMKDGIRSEAAKICETNNASDKTEDVVKAVTDAIDCANALVDPVTINQEINKAKPQGNLNEVFKKFCRKIPDFKVCLNKLSNGLKPCISEKYTGAMAEVRKGLESALDFVCYKDGDRIAKFIENGLKCLSEKREKVEECWTVTSLVDVKKMSTEAKCSKYDEMTSCVVKALEECSSPTPAIMVEDLLTYTRESTPCPKKAA